VASKACQHSKMSKIFSPSTAKPKNIDNPQSFSDYCAGIGYYSLRDEFPAALALIDTALSKFKSDAERYEILCMAGDCQRKQKIWEEAESLFKIAKDSAYEPVAARARLGLVECDVAKGNVKGAEQNVYAIIDEAKNVQKGRLATNAEGGYTINPSPMSPSAIAMRACSIFDRYGYGETGTKFLEHTVGNAPRQSARAGGTIAKRSEQSNPEKAATIYTQLLSEPKLGTREVDFLAGLIRVRPDISNQEVASYVDRFRPIAKPRAMFVVATAFRGMGRPEWIPYATKVSNPLNFSKKAKKASDHILAAEALKLLTKEAEIKKDWSAVSQFSTRLLSTKAIGTSEAVSAIRNLATAGLLQSGNIDSAKISELCSNSKNPVMAKYGVARALMQVEDFAGAEKLFQEIVADGEARGDWRSRARFSLAECYDKNGKSEQALQVYEEILKDPNLSQKFAVIAATKMIGPMSKIKTDQDKIVAQINSLVDKTNDYVSLLDIARIIKQNETLPAECYTRAYNKGRNLAVQAIESAKTPEIAMKTVFLLGRRQRDLLFYKEFVEDYNKYAEGRLEWLSRASAPYWEYGAFTFEIMNALNRPVEADNTWKKFVASAQSKPSGVELSHYHLFKGVVALNRGSEVAKEEFSKVIDLAPLHVNASRAYYWLALVDRGNGNVGEATQYAMRGLNATGVQGGYVWQQKLRKKLAVLASNFDIEKAAPGKHHVAAYKKAADDVMLDLKRVEKLLG